MVSLMNLLIRSRRCSRGCVFRSIDKMNAMRSVRQKFPAGFHRFQYSSVPFFPEKNVDGTSLCDQFHQGCGLMSAEVVRDEYPPCVGVCVNCLPDMSDIVIPGPGRADRRCDDPARGDFEVGNQAECATNPNRAAAGRSLPRSRRIDKSGGMAGFGFTNPNRAAAGRSLPRSRRIDKSGGLAGFGFTNPNRAAAPAGLTNPAAWRGLASSSAIF